MNKTTKLISISLFLASAWSSTSAVAAYTATALASVTARGALVVGGEDSVVDGVSDFDRRTVQTGVAMASIATGINAQLGSATAGGAGSGWAQVAPGGIHLSASGIGSASFLAPADRFSNVIGRGMGSATGSFSDALTISAPSLAIGAPVMLSFSVAVSGSLGGQGQFASGVSGYGVSSSVSWSVLLGDGGDGASEELHITNDDVARSGGLQAVQTIVVTVPNGIASTLTLRAAAGASTQGGIVCGACGFSSLYAEGSAFADFSQTFGWNGIQGVTDGSGRSLDLSELQVLSSSGFDYRQAYVSAVPEPSVAALLAAGLSLLAVWARRRAVGLSDGGGGISRS